MVGREYPGRRKAESCSGTWTFYLCFSQSNDEVAVVTMISRAADVIRQVWIHST